jgi:hypothetical protein
MVNGGWEGNDEAAWRCDHTKKDPSTQFRAPLTGAQQRDPNRIIPFATLTGSRKTLTQDDDAKRKMAD